MNTKKYRIFLEAAEVTAEELGASIYRHYSGRGMFGRQCLGITFDRDTPAVLLGAQLFAKFLKFESEWSYDPDRVSEAEVLDLLSSSLTDQMGKGTIVYFPTLEDPVPVIEEDF